MFRKYFSKGKQSQNIVDPFEGWPPSPSLSESDVPDLFYRRTNVESLEVLHVKPQVSFRPAVIVTLGQSGALACKELTQQPGIVSGIESGTIQLGCLLKDQDSIILNTAIRSFTIRPVDVQHNRRSYADGFEISAANHLSTWIANFLQNKQNNARVYLLGSVFDPLIGVVPRLLQLLKFYKGFSTTFAFLVADTPAGEIRLSDYDAAAALREIGRFMLKENHILANISATQEDRIIFDQELLNHLFLLSPDFEGSKKGSYENTIGQALWESVYSLLHPSGEMIHQRLANSLTQASAFTVNGGTSMISSCSVASLRAPLAELEEYVAARMAAEIIFDEQFGLLSQHRRYTWRLDLTNCHPLFSWIFGISEDKHPVTYPKILNTDLFALAFRNILANSVNQFLNKRGTLKDISEGIEHIDAVLEKFNIISRDSGDQNCHLIHELIIEMRADLEKVRKVVDLWGSHLFGLGFLEDTNSTNKIGLMNPFDALQMPLQAETTLITLARNAVDNTLEWLKQTSRHSYSYSVLNVQNPQLLEEFYKLVSPPLEVRDLAEKLQKRLGWWSRWNQLGFNLSLVFLPDDWQPGQEKLSATYSTEEVHELFEKILRHTKIKSSDIRAHFTDEYFDMLMARIKSNLCDANQIPYLGFDLSKSLSYQRSPNSRLGFVIGRDINQSSKLLDGDIHLFNSLTSGDIVKVAGNEPTRITAFGLNTFIPLTSIYLFAKGKDDARYILPQELNAYEYEKATGGPSSEFMFSPEIVSTLWSQNVVRLFFRLLFYEVIDIDHSHSTKLGDEASGKWQMKAVSTYPTYPLSDNGDIVNLLDAYHNFVVQFLVKPGAFPLRTNDSNNPFSLRNRVNYLNALRDECKNRRQNGKQINNIRLDDWQKQLRLSNRISSKELAVLMHVERKNLSRPIEEFSEPLFG